jgi:hypothetical protein
VTEDAIRKYLRGTEVPQADCRQPTDRVH